MLRREQKGFTLIELMIVVAIIGILAAVAIPAFIRYMQDAKSSEFEMNLKTITDGAMVYWDKDQADTTGLGYLPKSLPVSVMKTPSGNATCDKKNPSTITWAIAGPGGWDDLRFVISKPFLGHYQWLGAPNAGAVAQTGLATAYYDVDCDGVEAQKDLTVTRNTEGFMQVGVFVQTTED